MKRFLSALLLALSLSAVTARVSTADETCGTDCSNDSITYSCDIGACINGQQAVGTMTCSFTRCGDGTGSPFGCNSTITNYSCTSCQPAGTQPCGEVTQCLTDCDCGAGLACSENKCVSGTKSTDCGGSGGGGGGNSSTYYLTSVTPNTVMAGTPDLGILLQGGGFNRSSYALWGDVPLDSVVDTDNEMSANVPASLLARPRTVQISVTDPRKGQTASVPFTITAPPPVAQDATYTTAFNTPVTVTMTATDAFDLPRTYWVLSKPAHGTLGDTSSHAATVAYSPNNGFVGEDSFTFEARNGYGASNTATIKISVLPPTVAPIADAQTVNTPFRTPITISLTGSDPNGTALQFAATANPSHGAISGITGNQVTYTPNADFGGASDTFYFKVTDQFGLQSAPAPVTVNVGLPTNGRPLAASQAVFTPFRTPVTITLQGSDPNGLALHYDKVSDPGHGSVTAISGDQVTYTPAPEFGNAADSFTFKAINIFGQDSDPATVVIQVGLPAAGPVAISQTLSTPFRTPLSITLAGTDPNGLPLTYVKTSDPAHGTVSAISGSNILYTPTADFGGAADGFTFKVINSLGQESAPASVTIQVALPSDAPTATPQTVSTPFRTPVTITFGGSDPNGLPLTFATTGSPEHGTLTPVVNGQAVYTPAPDFAGTDSVPFKAVNSLGVESSPAAVTIQVGLPTNGLPVADPQTVSTPFRTPIRMTLTGSDPNGLALTFVKAADPSHGTVLAIAGNQITYLPNADFGGASDAFAFEVVNSLGQRSTPATVTVNVGLPTNGLPVADAQNVSTPFRTPVMIALTGSDPNGLPLSYVKVDDPSHGTLTAITGNRLTYTPAPDFGGAADGFRFKVVNSLGQESGPATITIDVGIPVNAMPVAWPQQVTTPFRTPIRIELAGADPNNLALTYERTGDVSHGSLSALSGNVLTYTPAPDFGGAADAFTFKVRNVFGQESNSATVAIQVGLPTNGLPAADPQTVSTPFRTPVTITLTGSDPNGLTLHYVKVDDPSHGTVTSVNGNQITYTPAPDFGGADDRFTFKAVNSLGQESAPASVTIQVGLPTNGLPVADAQNVSTPFRTPVTITLSGSDPNGLALTYIPVTGPAHGGVTAVSGRQLTYTPAPDFGGANDSFMFKVRNNLGQESAPAPVTIQVGLPTNGLPVADRQTVTTPFRTPITITLSGTDPNGLDLSYVKVADPARGTVSAISARQITYTPAPDFGGAAETFTFKVVNIFGQESAPAAVTVNVSLPTNGLPVADPQTVTTPFRTPVTITLAGSDPNGLTLAYVKVADPARGSVSAITGNQITYTPAPDFGGAADAFTFKVVNVLGQESAPATITVNVSMPTNGGPVADAQTVTTPFRTPVEITLTGSDPNGLSLTYVKLTDPVAGTLSALTGSNITYTPAPDFGGASETFTFKVVNRLGQESAPAAVTVHVALPANGLPVATPQTLTTPFRTPIAITLSGSDPNGLPITIVKVSDPSRGMLTPLVAGRLTYTPESNLSGAADAFLFKVVNSLGQASAPAAVTIQVGAPDLPVAFNQQLVTPYNTAVTATLTGSDPNNFPLTFDVASTPAHGTAVVTGDQVTYQPNRGFAGTDTFTFTVSNGFVTSLPGTVTVTVSPAGVGDIDHIVVEPDGRTIRAGDELPFVARAYDADNRYIPNMTFAWSFAGTEGSLSSGGLFRSVRFSEPGTRTYTVTAGAGGKSGTARVHVYMAPTYDADLCGAVAYPVPFKAGQGDAGVTFGHLSADTGIRIFSSNGRAIRQLRSMDGESVLWDTRNDDNEPVASGVYLYVLDGHGPCARRKGKLVIIR